MKTIYRILSKGLITVLPITLTLYLLVWLTQKIDQIFGAPLERILGEHYFTGLGLIIGVSVFFVVGFLVNNFVALSMLSWVERRLTAIPFVKAIYRPLRDVMNLFSTESNAGLKRVVLVELSAGSGTKALGLVTRDNFKEFNSKSLSENVAVFIPLSYALGGFTILVPRDRIEELDIPVDRAMQLAITGWAQAK